MDLHTIKKADLKRKPRMRVGRGTGSGMGKTSSRGHKGWGQRKGGRKGKPLYEGGNLPLFRRLPKRGFSNADFKLTYQCINVRDLNRFADDAQVTPAELISAGLIRKRNHDRVKILGAGDLKKKLIVTARLFSKGAREKIQAAGGQALEQGASNT